MPFSCNISFKISLFFLASAPFISICFLLFSSVVGSFLNKKNFFNDKWNMPLIICSFLMLISCLFSTFFNNYLDAKYWDYSLSWIGLLNWLPFFWFFWALQPFLMSPKDRELCGKFLIAGSIPVLATCIIHYFLEWNGPYSILNGLIIWFQKPISPNEGITGLFNNPNYTGSWLNIIWPFLLASFLNKSNNKYYKIITLVLIIFTSFSIFLTLSRNAWLGYFLTLFLTLFSYSKIKSFFFLVPVFLATLIYFLSNFDLDFIVFLINKLNREISPDYYNNIDITRLNIWFIAIKFILQKPLFGWGAASFPALLNMDRNIWKGHTHNLFLEIAISYGLPALALIFSFIFIIIYKNYKIFLKDSFRKSFTNEKLFENAWLFSFIILIISQLFDVQYFDVRISLIFWILLAGLKNKIIQQKLIFNENLANEI